MAVIDKKWHGENLRISLYIGNEVYTTYVEESYTIDGQTAWRPNKDKFIYSMDISDSDGNTNVNPLGIMSSSRISINCFDADCLLSPTNPDGYGALLTNGLKLEVDILDGNGDWQSFGTYYTTSFSDVYSDGYHGLTNICAEDTINIIGNMDVPKLDVYANIPARTLIADIFDELEILNYSIDPSLDMSFTWGVLPGTKVRDFLNSVCQRCFARIITDNAGAIKFVPALTLASTYNSIQLNYNDLSSLKNLNSNNINYNKISVKYYPFNNDKLKVLYQDSELSFQEGHVTIDDISFNDIVVSIENVIITFKQNGSLVEPISNIEYRAYQNGMVLEFDAMTDLSDVDIYIEGYVSDDKTLKQSIDIDTGNRVGLQEYIFEPKMQMTDAQALALCSSIRNYMSLIENKIEINDTAITPFIDIGDLVEIDVDNSTYAGRYKVVELNISFGETYKNSMKLLRLGQ